MHGSSATSKLVQDRGVRNLQLGERQLADILLIQPPPFGAFCPPLGIATLSAYLKSQGIEALTRDYNIKFYVHARKNLGTTWELSTAEDIWIDPQSYADRIQSTFKEFSRQVVRDILLYESPVVGISVLNAGMNPTLDLIATIREFFGETVKVVLGGPTMNFANAQALMLERGVYAVFIGEAEIGLTELLKQLKSGEPVQWQGIPGVVYRDGDQIRVNENSIIGNLSTLPLPDFSGFDLDEYGIQERILPITTSRGCVARCRFCAETNYMKKFRQLDPDRIVAELKNGVEQYGVGVFRINDSLINGDLEALEGWLDQLIASGIRIEFGGAQARINSKMSDALLEKLRIAGCKLIIYGVETGSNRLLKIMRKGINTDQAIEVIRRTHAAGVNVQINIIVGHFEETWRDYWETLKFIVRVRRYLTYLNVNCYTFDEGSIDTQVATGIVNRQMKAWHKEDGSQRYVWRRLKQSIIMGMIKVFGIKFP